MTTDVMTWLTEVRKLDRDLVEAFGVKQTDHPGMGRAVAFPYVRNGKTYAAKFRSLEGKDWRSTKDVSRGLYNEDDLDRLEHLPIVITEGEIDALSCIQAGFERSVSLPDGWTEQGNKTDALIAAEDRLRNSPYVIVAGDNDKVGESLPRTVARILRGHDVRWAKWPEPFKDANEVLVHLGEGAVASCLNDAKTIDPPGGFVTSISDLPPMSTRRVLRTGLSGFDRVVALELGAISVWTGIPGSGKSTFLTWAVEKVTVNENVRAGIFAFETHPHTLRDQLSLIRTGKDFAALDEIARSKLLENLDRRFRIVHRTFEDDAAHRIGWLEEMIYNLALRDQCKVIVIDPWNELEHLPEPGESLTNYINWALQRIRQLAEHLEIHIAIVAHPKKLHDTFRAPTGYDVADSAAFSNKPSLGVSVHQRETDDGDHFVELNVWKVRNTRLYGFHKGRTNADFDADTQSYIERRQRPD